MHEKKQKLTIFQTLDNCTLASLSGSSGCEGGLGGGESGFGGGGEAGVGIFKIRAGASCPVKCDAGVNEWKRRIDDSSNPQRHARHGNHKRIRAPQGSLWCACARIQSGTAISHTHTHTHTHTLPHTHISPHANRTLQANNAVVI